MIYTLFVVLIVLVSFLMIGIVLIQESKGGGLSSQFSASNQIMGVRKTTDVVEKITWTLAAIMVAISVVCAYTAPKAATEESVMEQSATQNAPLNPVNTQGFGAAKPAEGAAQPAEGAAAPAPAQQPAQQAPAK